MSSSPRVSVVMCAYNEQAHIEESVASILSQTYSNFEFIIVDDASTDNTVSKIHQFKDSRIKLIQNEDNLGLTKSLNIGLKAARGEYIARMDADDISLPSRIEKQVVYMDNNPTTILCGTWANLFGDKEGNRKHSSNNYELKIRTLFSCQFIHPTVMLRLSTLSENQLWYDESFKQAQDYEFWSRLISYGDYYTIPEVLLNYRVHDKQVSSKSREKQLERTYNVYQKIFEQIGLRATEKELEHHYQLSFFDYKKDTSFVIETGKWFEKILIHNSQKNHFPQEPLIIFLNEYYYNLICNSINGKLKNLILLQDSPPSLKYIRLTFSQKLKAIIIGLLF